MKFTLRQLQIFLATAHHGNITKAADELAMSQSAASGALKDLESQFEVKLFDRIGKKLQLNELGERIRVKTEALMAQAKDLESELNQHSALGGLKIGATLTIGNYLCADLITTYQRSAADAHVHLEVANTAHIAEEILNFDIDLGLVEGEIQHTDLKIIPWKPDKLICFCHPEHPFATMEIVEDEALKSAQWILREPGSGTRQTFDRAMAGIAPQIKVELELQHTEAIKHAVGKNLGVSCLSEITLIDEFSRGSLVPFKVASKNFNRHFYFVIHKQKYLSAGILHWMKLCGINNTRDY